MTCDRYWITIQYQDNLFGNTAQIARLIGTRATPGRSPARFPMDIGLSSSMARVLTTPIDLLGFSFTASGPMIRLITSTAIAQTTASPIFVSPQTPKMDTTEARNGTIARLACAA